MNNKTFNIIFKIVTIILAILSFVGAVKIWFLNCQINTFAIGWNYFFIGVMATLMTMAKITGTKK